MFDIWTYNEWNTLANWVYAIATLTLAAAAWVGVVAWRSQLRNRYRFRLARAVSVKVSRFRRELLILRNPLLFRESWDGWLADTLGQKHPSPRFPKTVERQFSRLFKSISAIESAIIELEMFDRLGVDDLLLTAGEIRILSQKLNECTTALAAILFEGNNNLYNPKNYSDDVQQAYGWVYHVENPYARSKIEDKMGNDFDDCIRRFSEQLNRYFGQASIWNNRWFRLTVAAGRRFDAHLRSYEQGSS